MSFTELEKTLIDLRIDLPEVLRDALTKNDGGALNEVGARGRLAVTDDARVRMSPELSYGRHAGPAPHSARHAAVMLLLFPRDDRWHVPLTVRPTTLARHGGQVSLPGGAIDAGETSQQAALRELHEELGTTAAIDVLGQLAECYVFASDFRISPWVAATHEEPDWRPHDREVQDVVELPLELLVNANLVTEMTIERGPMKFRAPCLEIGDIGVWGATCVILEELALVLRQLSATVAN